MGSLPAHCPGRDVGSGSGPETIPESRHGLLHAFESPKARSHGDEQTRETRIGAADAMTPCPALNQLQQMLAGELGDSERAALTAHVEECACCQQALENWLAEEE